MGWIGRAKDGMTTHEVVTEELESGSAKVVGHSGKYYALQLKDGDVIGVVALVEHGSSYGERWIYTKMVSEDMGPYERECPAKILDLLTPIEELDSISTEHAADWREDCRKNIELKKAQPRLKPGMKIRVPNGITFVGDWVADTFTFEGKFTFRADNGVRVRLPRNWKTRYTWEVVA